MNRNDKIQLLKLLQEKERRTLKNDLVRFVEEYVNIEDKDSEQIVSKFKLWDEQKKTLLSLDENRLNIILKARQLGITWLTLAYSTWKIMHNQGYQVVALSKTETDAKELIRRLEFILRHMPDWVIRHKDNVTKGLPSWDSTALSITVYHEGKEPAVFNAMSAGRDSGRSFTANLVMLDEWAFQQWAREIWAAAYPTVNRPTGGKVIGLSTAKRLTLFEEIWKKSVAGLNSFNRIFLSWRTDPRRTEEWFKQTKEDLGEQKTKEEFPSTPEEAFEAAEGSAFPEFSYGIHVVESFNPPKYWKRWRSIDNGYTDPFAWYWYAVDEQGVVHVYREYTRETDDEKVTYSEQGKQATLLSVGENLTTTVVGHDAYSQQGARFGNNKSLLDYYVEGGCIRNFTKANTDRRLGKMTINEYLKPYHDANDNTYKAKLVIHDCCTKLIETLPQLLIDDKDNEKVAECTIDHWFDSLRYGLNYWHSSTQLQQGNTMTIEQQFFGVKKEKKPFGTTVDESFLNYGTGDDNF